MERTLDRVMRRQPSDNDDDTEWTNRKNNVLDILEMMMANGATYKLSLVVAKIIERYHSEQK